MWLFYFCKTMTLFDQLFFGVFNYYKSRKNKKAITISLLYITLVHVSMLFVLGVFFSEFLKQMKITAFSDINAYVLLAIVTIIMWFKNWIQYSGRKLTIRKAKKNNSKSVERSIYVLWLVPIALLGLSFILLNIL